MDWLVQILVKNPELPVFLAIGVGYWIGKFKYKGVGFGPVTGSLIAGLLIGYFSAASRTAAGAGWASAS